MYLQLVHYFCHTLSLLNKQPPILRIINLYLWRAQQVTAKLIIQTTILLTDIYINVGEYEVNTFILSNLVLTYVRQTAPTKQ